MEAQWKRSRVILNGQIWVRRGGVGAGRDAVEVWWRRGGHKEHASSKFEKDGNLLNAPAVR